MRPKQILDKTLQWFRSHWRIVAIIGGALIVALILAQLVYPGGRLLPLAQIDGQSVGGWKKGEVVAQLNDSYDNKKISINFGDLQDAAQTVQPEQIGLEVGNQDRIYSLSYPWYLRIVPTSIVWAQHAYEVQAPSYQRTNSHLQDYIENEIGDSCEVEPVDASLKAINDKLELVSATPGGTCELSDIESALANVRPVLTEPAEVNIEVSVLPPEVADEDALALAQDITQRLGDGVVIQAGDEQVEVATGDIISWMDFATEEGELTASMNSKRAADYLNENIGPQVAQPAGVTTIKTRDYVVVARDEGPSGRALAVTKTLDNILQYINNQSDEITAVTRSIKPTIEYVRTYSSTDTGLTALLEQYAEDHRGTYGISLVELSGERRHASFQADKRFTTASTYKLYVAYSVLDRVEAGQWSWSDRIVNGRNLERCFNDMISLSDNPCAEALLGDIGYSEITKEMHELGLHNTTFLEGDTPLTTAGDLATFLSILEADQMLTQDSRDRLTSAMKGNIFREGIAAGASGEVANKVGFLEDLLHDAAIVYSPNGTYVLTVMSDGSSWSRIADLAEKIDELRAR